MTLDKKKTILIVDDDPGHRATLKTILGSLSYQIDEADDGSKALEKVRGAPFDLILMDVQMPELNGFEATLAIREKEKETDSHIPIIAMTARAMKGDKERCLEVGMDGYVSKPVRSEALVETINTLLPTS